MKSRIVQLASKLFFTLFVVAFGATLVASTGCQKEEVLDVETPAGSVEVNKDTTDGSIEVDVDKN